MPSAVEFNHVSKQYRTGIELGSFMIMYLLYAFFYPTCAAALNWYALLFSLLGVMDGGLIPHLRCRRLKQGPEEYV